VNVPPGQPPWRSAPSTTARRSTGFSKQKSGAGCAGIAIGVFAFVCVVAGAVALVFFLKSRRGAVEEAVPTGRPATTGSAPRQFRPPVKRN
jgi:hypothetical protein